MKQRQSTLLTTYFHEQVIIITKFANSKTFINLDGKVFVFCFLFFSVVCEDVTGIPGDRQRYWNHDSWENT
jgi:hypothetical protein